MQQRGELLTALLNGRLEHGEACVKGVFDYVIELQQERLQKSRHMRELGLKGVAARLKKISEAQATVMPRISAKERKVTKERNYIKNKNNLNFLENSFQPPDVKSVQAYVDENELKVDAETFVDFYQSRGWMVGKTPIRCWQSVAKLWHARALKSQRSALSGKGKEDESYWQELQDRVSSEAREPEVEDILSHPLSEQARRNLAPDMPDKEDLDLSRQPFERFMNRVKKYDIKSENENE